MAAEKYFTGRPCKYGHVAPRFVSTGICTECNRVKAAQFRSKYPEKARQSVAAAWKKNRERYRAEHTAATARWRSNNPEKAKATRARRYERVGRLYGRIARSLRRARILQRTPRWADLNGIKAFFKLCPRGHHVDHIVPLCGRRVSGLHVPANLQYLPALENQRKHNTFDPMEFT